MKRAWTWGLPVAVVVVAGAWWWLQSAPPAVPEPAEPVASVEPVPQAPDTTAPALRHPIEAVGQALGLGTEDAAAPPPTLEQRLADLVGRDALLTFVVTDQFARRVAATVDNLGRAHAPSALWPVQPTPGRFEVATLDGAPARSDVNARRYDAFVRFATGIDPARAVALYVRLYPQLQAAYEALGFPGRSLNDRVVDVVDLLLATPSLDGPVALHLTEIKGPIPSTRPWVRYEFADPALESLAAGQKILLRVGPAHAAALKAWLAQVRPLLAGQAVRR